jgi:6-phosphogluconate dehydrogenase
MESSLNVGLVGLGRMGLGIAERLAEAGHRVAAFDLSADARRAAADVGAAPVATLADLPGAVALPRVVWLMVPAGPVVDQVLLDGPEALAARLSPGDIVIDGGNSHFHDSQRRAKLLAERCGATMLDCGTSGGVEGQQSGYCLMVGGDRAAYDHCTPAFAAIAAPDGYAHVGPSGAGHFVKMVHNAMEYGFLQVLGEGFALLDAYEAPLNMPQLARLWNHGSVIRSWLMDLAAQALSRPNHFEKIAPVVGGGSTGTWAVEEAGRRGMKLPAIELSLRERTGQPSNEFAARMVAALRYEFGRHPLTLRP